MDKLIFRFISPIISGFVIYLLILLFYNYVDHILANFLSEELFICIGLSFLISESTRWALQFYKMLNKRLHAVWSIFIIVLITLITTITIVVVGLRGYYLYTLGYPPHFSEIQIFLILYTGQAIALTMFFLSNHYVREAHYVQLKSETHLKEQSRDNFTRFTRGINSELLFECLETIIASSRQNIEKADEIIDCLSLVYRYTLTKNQIELIDIKEESHALNAFVQLIDHLPYRSVRIENLINSNTFVVPGTLLNVVEQIIKTTIAGSDESIVVKIYDHEDRINIEYVHQDKLTDAFTIAKIVLLISSYSVYTESPIKIEQYENKRIISIPQLHLQDNRDENIDH